MAFLGNKNTDFYKNAGLLTLTSAGTNVFHRERAINYPQLWNKFALCRCSTALLPRLTFKTFLYCIVWTHRAIFSKELSTPNRGQIFKRAQLSFRYQIKWLIFPEGFSTHWVSWLKNEILICQISNYPSCFHLFNNDPFFQNFTWILK